MTVRFRAPDGSIVALPGPLDECPWCAPDEKCAVCLAMEDSLTAVAIGEWDPTKHPREPPGSQRGGEFARTGRVPYSGGTTPPGFPDGIFDAAESVKFWPERMGAYYEDGRDHPMWKAILTPEGEELAFWFVDPGGYPHHGHMQRALGIPGGPDNRHVAVAGWGVTADTDWMVRVEMPPGEIEASKQIPIRHRRDISDAEEMVTDETRLMVASALLAALWDETKHPRQPKGSDKGGEFTSRPQVIIVHPVRAFPDVAHMKEPRLAWLYWEKENKLIVSDVVGMAHNDLHDWLEEEQDDDERSTIVDVYDDWPLQGTVYIADVESGPQAGIYYDPEDYNDGRLIPRAAVAALRSTFRVPLRSPDAVVGAAWDETKHPRHPRGTEYGGEFAPKGGDTFVGLQGFERGPGKVVIEGERPRIPTSDVFEQPWVPLDEAVTREGWREENPQYEQVDVGDLVPTQDVMSAVRVQEYVQELQQDGNLDELLDSTRIVEGDDGRLYVADGHNRVAAAIETGNPTLRLPVIRPTPVPAPTPLWARTSEPRGAGNPEGFGPGEFTPDDPDVKFWPRHVGSYSGFIPDAPYGPFWKSLIDPKTGDELAFWFADTNGLPHHDAMQRALGHVPSDRIWFPYSGYGVTGEATWGASRMSDADRKLMSGRTEREVEIEHEIVRRHRRDIKDANAMLPENQAMAAAASPDPVDPASLTPDLFNEIVAAEADLLDRYEEPLAVVYRGVIRKLGKAMAARFRKLAPIPEGLAAAAEPAPWNPPTVAELLAAAEEVDRAVERAEKIQATAFEQIVEGILARVGISFEVRALLTQALLNGLGARAVEMIEGIRVPVARAIANAYLNGLSVPQTAAAIMEAVDGLSATQATMLARNDLIGISNGGSLTSARILKEKFPAVALGYKEWLATDDERTRPTHNEAHGQRVPIETPFVVGGAALAYPGDPTGPDKEVINCRCTLIYRAEPKTAVTAAGQWGLQLRELTAAFDESQHPRDPGGEGGGEFIEKDTTGVDEGTEDRLDLKGGPDAKKMTKPQVTSRMKKVVADVSAFYGGRACPVEYEPDACEAWGVDATTRVQQLGGEAGKQIIYFGAGVMEQAQEPDFGVFPYRQIAHEAIHGTVSGDRFTSGFYHDYEEGGCEILSINYWAQRGQPFDKRDAVRVEGRWTEPGAESLAHSVVYRNETADLLRRAASAAGGWDREKVVAQVVDVVKGDSNNKLRFRDSTDPEFPPPEGYADDAVGLIRWLIDRDALTAAPTLIPWDPEKHPRHPAGSSEGGEFAPKNYHYGARLVEGGYQPFRIEKGKTRYDFTREDIGPVYETYQEALKVAQAAFEEELAADAAAVVKHQDELVAQVDEQRSRPGQGVKYTRTTTPVEGQTGTRDALVIQAREFFAKEGMSIPDDESELLASYNEWTTDKMQSLTSQAAGARVAVRAPMDAVMPILNSGRIVPGFDATHLPNDRTSDDGYMESRGEREMRLFGSHPVYGYVALDDEDLDLSIAKAFGDVKFTLHDDVRPFTTVTYSDSGFIAAGGKNSDVLPRKIDEVDHRAVASWMNLGGVQVPVAYKGEKRRPEPEIPADTLAQWEQEGRRSFGWEPGEYVAMRKNEYLRDVDFTPWEHGDFIEAQIHMPLRINDVERVDFPVRPPEAVIDRLRELGIRWTVGGPDAP